ncbi:hypothetical protein ACFTY8_02710 [Streptomyces mirabilis]|uniref:hypothetical protein n=1 Tax=Streptomyces mirabilis TaxID=68239 RepID=UPI00363486AF
MAPIDAPVVGLDAVSEMLTVQRDWLRALDRGKHNGGRGMRVVAVGAAAAGRAD